MLLSPFLPDTATKIFDQLNTDARSIETINTFGALKEGTKLAEPVHLFDRIEVSE